MESEIKAYLVKKYRSLENNRKLENPSYQGINYRYLSLNYMSQIIDERDILPY
jgi:hypothetical protein